MKSISFFSFLFFPFFLFLSSCEEKYDFYKLNESYPLEIELFGPYTDKKAVEIYDSLESDSLMNRYLDPRYDYHFLEERDRFLIKIKHLSATDSLFFSGNRLPYRAFIELSATRFNYNQKGFLQECVNGLIFCGDGVGWDTILPNAEVHRIVNFMPDIEDSFEGSFIAFNFAYIWSSYFDTLNKGFNVWD